MSKGFSRPKSAATISGDNISIRGGSEDDNFWRVEWGASGGVVGTALILLFVLGLVSLITSAVGFETNIWLGVVYSISGMSTIIGCVYFLFVKRESLNKFFGGKPRLNLLLIIPLAYMLYFQLTWIALKLAEVLFSVQVNEEQSFGFEGSYSDLEKIVIFIALVIVAPIAEEMLYRGILYKGLRRSWGRLLAAILTSAVFGILHGQWNVAVDTFVLSLVLISVMEYTKSLWGPIALHGTKNFVAFILVFSGLI